MYLWEICSIENLELANRPATGHDDVDTCLKTFFILFLDDAQSVIHETYVVGPVQNFWKSEGKEMLGVPARYVNIDTPNRGDGQSCLHIAEVLIH